MSNNKRASIPCLHAYIDSEGFFCCQNFVCTEAAHADYTSRNEEIPVCCDTCVHDKSYCAACGNLTAENDPKVNPSCGFCSIKQEYRNAHKPCEAYVLRLFDNEEATAAYLEYKE